jgi:hypothetical protein
MRQIKETVKEKAKRIGFACLMPFAALLVVGYVILLNVAGKPMNRR